MDVKKSFCINCKSEVSNDTKKCKCGSTNFAYGNLKVVNNNIVCICGNASFRRGMHMDFTDRAVTSMVCTECGASAGTEYYRTKDDMMYWGDDYDYDNTNDKYQKRVKNRQILFNKRKALGRV